MQTVRLVPGNESPAATKALDALALAVAKGKRTVLLVGAGISTNAGIPDFRSSGTGLYSSGSSSSPSPLPPTTLKGPDLFSASVYSSPDTTSEHLRFIAHFKRSLDDIEQRCSSSSSAASTSSPSGTASTRPATATHDFMRLLKKRGKLQRVYTQNIDGLEGVGTGLVPVALEGITPSASLPEGKGKGKPKIEGDYVQLHGSVHAVRCTSCAFVRRWTEEDVKAFEAGHVGACPECEGKAALRSARGQRTLTSLSRAYLRPSIVLYSEPPPLSSSLTIGSLSLSDLSSSPGPDVMLVMGTSLRIPGFKKLVKEFSKSVGSRGGVRVLVNREEIGGRSEWKGVFDYEIIADTDSFVTRLIEGWKRLRPHDWTGRQTTLGEVFGPAANVKKGVLTDATQTLPRHFLTPNSLSDSDKTPSHLFSFQLDVSADEEFVKNAIEQLAPPHALQLEAYDSYFPPRCLRLLRSGPSTCYASCVDKEDGVRFSSRWGGKREGESDEGARRCERVRGGRIRGGDLAHLDFAHEEEKNHSGEVRDAAYYAFTGEGGAEEGGDYLA
ncbi:NAD-dependent deacetylase hst3 [Rhodotorula toruloides]